MKTNVKPATVLAILFAAAHEAMVVDVKCKDHLLAAPCRFDACVGVVNKPGFGVWTQMLS